MYVRFTDKGAATVRLMFLGEYEQSTFPGHLFDGGRAKGWKGRLYCWWLGRRVWLLWLIHGKGYERPARRRY